jgi:UDPglucose 6-dehydrogenase
MVEKTTIGIVGYGFVGKAVAQLNEFFPVEIYDPFIDEYMFNLKAFKQDIVFVCVPTPSKENGELDTTIVEQVTKQWRGLTTKESILVVKSTVPPGTTAMLCNMFSTDKIIHNPEFLSQNTAMEDFRKPEEVVIGHYNRSAAEKLVNLYKKYYPLNLEVPYYVGLGVEAEMLKMVRNSYYALKVSFFNQVEELCDMHEIEYSKFREMLTLGGRHPWLASQHTMVPGPDGKYGFGGACLPKDSEGLCRVAEQVGVEMTVLKEAIAYNKRRRNETE